MTPPTTRTHPRPSLPNALRTVAIRTITVVAPLSLALSAVLLVRGAFREQAETQPLVHASAALLASLFMTSAYLALRQQWRAQLSESLASWLPPTALAAILFGSLGAIAFSASGWEWWFVWLSGGGAAIAVWLQGRHPVGHPAGVENDVNDVVVVPELPSVAASEDEQEVMAEGMAEDDDGDLDCRLERRRTESGEPLITIWQRVQFQPWEQRATLHFPFWPPLRAPQVSGETIADCEAELKIQQVETHGCRVQIHLEEADERSQEVIVELCVIAAAEPEEKEGRNGASDDDESASDSPTPSKV